MKPIRKHSIMAIAAWTVLLLILAATDPTKVPLFFIVVPFFILYIALRSSLMLMQFAWLRVYKAVRQNEDTEITAKPSTWWATAVSIFLVSIALLGSLGQLTVRDIAGLLALFLFSAFYISRLRGRQA